MLRAPLLAAVDGRNSPTREAAGIRSRAGNTTIWRSSRRFGTSGRTSNIAYEIFFPTGRSRLLPMTDDAAGHRSAIVWSVPKDEDAAGWMSLSDEHFAGEAQAAMGGFLGKIAMAAPRSTFPLGFHHAARITDDRLALVGDAAHAIHPIAGQGLNLGFRDVAALAQVLVEGARLGLDLGDRQLLDRYQRWRSLDALLVSLATDSLTRSLRHSRQDGVGGAPLRHGHDRPLEPDQEPADERSARHQRRASAAASRAADLDDRARLSPGRLRALIAASGRPPRRPARR